VKNVIRLNFELILDSNTAFYVTEYKLNVAEIAVNAVKEAILRENDIRQLQQVNPSAREKAELIQALTDMRKQRDAAIEQLQEKPKKKLWGRL
jgi:hypothetical protein